jgi:uncharacterized membrane protein YfcA
MIWALFGAIAIGLSLGLLGSGGSILTLPILVYVLDRPDKPAIAESLAIVGAIALAGCIPYAFRLQIHWRTVLFFGLSGIAGAYAGACLSSYISGSLQLSLFSVVLLLAAGLMIKDFHSSAEPQQAAGHPAGLLILEGFLLGNLTGCLGIGGGFLIVPILVLLVKLPMYSAIGTSLVIIALNAFTAFVKHFNILHSQKVELDWSLIGLFILVGVIGSLAGSFIAKRISQKHLKKAFGWILVPLGIYIFFAH